MHRMFAGIIAFMTGAMIGVIALGPGVAGGTAAQSGQGVTPTSIKLGITYLDAAAIKNVVNIDPGNFKVAYTALIDQINAKGGINGRKIVPVFERSIRSVPRRPPPHAPSSPRTTGCSR